MLRKIKDARDAVSAADQKSKGKKETELNALLSETRASHVACVRDEVARIRGKEALESIAILGDLIIMPVMLQVLDDLKKLHERHLSELLLEAAGRDLVKEFKSTSVIDILNAQLPKPIDRLFEIFFDDKKLDAITQDSVTEFIATTVEKVCKHLAAKAKLDAAKLSSDFIEWVQAEVVRACTQDIVKQADSRQTASTFFSAVSVVSLSHDKIMKPFVALKFCFASLNVKQDTVDHWRDLTVWLEGLYCHHHELLQEKLRADKEAFVVKDGKICMAENKPYPTVSAGDMAMRSLFKLTFYDLALLVRDVSTALKLVLPPNQSAPEPALVSANGMFSAQAQQLLPVVVAATPATSESERQLDKITTFSP